MQTLTTPNELHTMQLHHVLSATGNESSAGSRFQENENVVEKDIDVQDYKRLKANEAKQKEADAVRRAKDAERKRK